MGTMITRNVDLSQSNDLFGNIWVMDSRGDDSL